MANLKVDLKKKLKAYYNPPRTPEIITIPPMNYLMIDGKGITGCPEFQNAIETLFSVSYKTKFMAKKNRDFDYTVMPLEGLWWADNMDDFVSGKKEHWKWTLMIMQPDEISESDIHDAMEEVSQKKQLPASGLITFQKLCEGTSVQMMHIGPFSEEHANIIKMHEIIRNAGGCFDGKLQKHHEIYLNDFRKVAPEKMKTVLRQPFIMN